MGGGHRPLYLQPLLSLLPTLQCEHQDLGSPLGEAQLVPLVPAVLGHIDDIAGIQCQPQMWLPVLGAFITLDRKRRGQGFLEWRVEEEDTLHKGSEELYPSESSPTQPNCWDCRKTGARAGHPRGEGISLGNLQI